MATDDEVPEGAAVFPLIPDELGVHPLLLAVLHSVVFLIGSSEEVIEGQASEEAAQYILTYLQRLTGPELQRVREDLACLVEFARKEDWPQQDIDFLKNFLKEFGIGEESGD